MSINSLAPVDVDEFGADSYAAMRAELTAPAQAGATRVAVRGIVDPAPNDDRVRFDVPWTQRHPVFLARLRRSVGRDGLRAHANVGSDGGAADDGPFEIEFAAFSEAGAEVLVWAPHVAAGLNAPAVITINSAERVGFDGASANLDGAELADLVEVVVAEGVLAKMLVILGAEKQRIRRQALANRSARRIADARDNALDRIGADLGVARLTSALSFADGQIVVSDLTEVGPTGRSDEPDASYRDRLSLYRPWLFPNREGLLDRLNGPGLPGDPNRGLPARRGVMARFKLVETDDNFAVAVRIVATDAWKRDAFFDYVNAVHLVEPGLVTLPESPANRLLPPVERARRDALRQRLREGLTLPAQARFAPQLAAALDRLVRVRRALGADDAIQVTIAFDPAGGSRYELGLGSELGTMSPASLDAMHVAIADAGRAVTDDSDAERIVAAIIADGTAASSADDAAGRWLFDAVGLRTVFPTADDRVYVSHLATSGLTIERTDAAADPAIANGPAAAQYAARYPSAGDSPLNMVLVRALAEAGRRWTDASGAAWVPITDDQEIGAVLAGATALTDSAADAVRGIGLRPEAVDNSFATRMTRLPAGLWSVVRLDPATTAILDGGGTPAGTQAAVDESERLLLALRDSGLASVIAAREGADIVLFLGVLGLPSVGVNLASARTTGFRWYAVPLFLDDSSVDSLPLLAGPVGSVNSANPTVPGLWAIVVSAYARDEGTDPYEIRVELPEGVVLSIDQYEFVMNLLDHAHPLGVEVNTWRLRHRHLDLDGDGVADTWTPSAQRLFRSYRVARAGRAISPAQFSTINE